MKKKIPFLFFFCAFAISLSAQNTLRKVILPYRDTIVLRDSFTILSHTVFIQNIDFQTINNFKFEKNKIIFENSFLKIKDSLRIEYRVLSFDLEKKFTNLDSSKILKREKEQWYWQPYKDTKNNSVLPDQKGLDYSGSFSRGIAVGNNQDLVVNSNFNLQMAGKLSQDIEVNAAITDNNIPIQPDGNTAQLNQFDRIFIELKRKNVSLTAGDFDFQKPESSYFMNYAKRAQGLSFSIKEKTKKKQVWQTRSAAAVSRGKFARQIVEPIEGNQGPYRLYGAAGERFVIVIAGTEKIYADGNLLKRGLDNDYVIDYNQGILIFTPKILIKRELRIITEFEYNDQNYVRSMYASDASLSFGRGKVFFNLYGEQDSRNSGTQGDFKDGEKSILATAGDAVNGIFASGVDTFLVFDKDRILYKIENDASGNPIFRYSQNKDSARYELKFVEVGQGAGDYNWRQSAANGRVYEYVGKGQGSFLIGKKLNTPKLLQLYSAGVDYQLFKKKNASLKAEVAMSNRDENRFSRFDDADNLGFATFLSYNQNFILPKKWKLNTTANFEKTQNRFQPLNPYRAVEFARDWNVANQLSRQAEQFFRGTVALQNDSLGNFQYEFNQFMQGGIYEGNRHNAFFQLQKKGWQLNTNYNYLTSNTLNEKTIFERPKFELKKSWKKNTTIGFYAEREKNKRNISDTLHKTSFYYDLWRAYVQIPSGKKLQWTSFYQNRVDFFPIQNDFQANIFTKELNTNLVFRSKKGFTLAGNMAYRNLTVENKKWTTQQAQETYLGRIDASLTKWKNAFSAQSTYELGSGQEQRIEYFYQKVETGKGNFTWRDVNKDQQIQQDEVFPVAFQDSANVIRFILPSNQFVRTNNLTFSQILNLTPKNIWAKDTVVWKRLFNRFSTETAWQVLRKVKVGAAVSPWNPFEQLSINDTALVAYGTNIRNILYFNRGNIRFDAQLGNTDNSNRNILTTGYEIRAQRENFLRFRWNLSKRMMLRTAFAQNIRVNESEFFPNRNFEIFTLIAEPELSWQPNRDFRLRMAYKFSNSLDSLAERETAQINDFNSEITFNKSIKTSIRTKVSFVKINYEGAKNSPVQYTMLNGLQNGNNFLWGLQLNQALNKTLQLEVRYDGRKTGDVRVVHTGNMAVRAMF